MPQLSIRLIENYQYDNSARKIELITATLNESHNIIKQLRSFEDKAQSSVGLQLQTSDQVTDQQRNKLSLIHI